MSSRSSNNFRLSGAEGSICERTPGRYSTRLQLGGYVADIVPDPESPCIYHCIVQRIGSPKVLYLRQEPTFAAAMECGHRHLQQLARNFREKAGAIYEFAPVEAMK